MQCGPFEGDHQLVHEFKEGRINSVWSNDKGILPYGVPLITEISENGRECKVIDMNSVNIPEIQNPCLRRYVELTRHNFNKRGIFAVISGSGILKRC